MDDVMDSRRRRLRTKMMSNSRGHRGRLAEIQGDSYQLPVYKKKMTQIHSKLPAASEFKNIYSLRNAEVMQTRGKFRKTMTLYDENMVT